MEFTHPSFAPCPQGSEDRQCEEPAGVNLPRSLALRQDAPPHLTISEPQSAFSSVYRIRPARPRGRLWACSLHGTEDPKRRKSQFIPDRVRTHAQVLRTSRPSKCPASSLTTLNVPTHVTRGARLWGTQKREGGGFKHCIFYYPQTKGKPVCQTGESDCTTDSICVAGAAFPTA